MLAVGTHVRINPCIPGKRYGGFYFAPGMTGDGRKHSVIYVNEIAKKYLLDNGFWYTEEMLTVIKY